MSAPLSSAELNLKQVKLDELGPVPRYAMENAFAEFYDDEKTAKKASAKLSKRMAGAEVHWDPSRPRRFAGDRTLPRGHYYSIALDEAGWDGHTLLQEMSAYLPYCRYRGLVSFFDNSMANGMELLGILAEIPKTNFKALDLSRPSFLVALRPLDGDAVLEDAYGPGRHYVVQVPFTLTLEVFEAILDLRDLRAQAWCVQQFARRFEINGKEFPVLIGRQPPSHFRELLPSLLDQWQGGGWTTGNLTGIFARHAGAEGLVYPSARSNASLVVDHGAVRNSTGWCFVRYVGAPSMEMRHAVSQASDAWPTLPGYAPHDGSWVEEFIPVLGTAIHHVTSGGNAESWQIEGLAEYNRGIYRLSQVMTILNALGYEEAAGGLAGLALHSHASDLEFVTRVMNGCLLGDARSKKYLAGLMPQALSDVQRTLYRAVLEAAERVPADFRVSGLLAQAWGYEPG